MQTKISYTLLPAIKLAFVIFFIHINIGNGDVVDNVDLMGMASRLSHQSDLRPATADRGHSSRYYKSKKSYDQALSTLAATLPLISGRRRSSLTHRDSRQISTAPRGRRGSRTIGMKYDTN